MFYKKIKVQGAVNVKIPKEGLQFMGYDLLTTCTTPEEPIDHTRESQ